MRFFVFVSVNEGWWELDDATRADISAKEALRGSELVRAGVIEQIWRIAGTPDNVGIWNCSDGDEVHELVSTLPAWRWLSVTVQALARHPLATAFATQRDLSEFE